MTFTAGTISASDIRSQLYNNPNDADSTAYGNGPISWSDLYGESNYIKDFGTGCNTSIPTSGTIGLSHVRGKEPLHNKMATGSNSTLDSTGIHPTNVRNNHMIRTSVSGAYNNGASTSSSSSKPHIVSMTSGTIHGTDQTGQSSRGTTGATGGVGFTANNPTVLSNNRGNKIQGGGGQGGGGGNRGSAGYGNSGNSGAAGTAGTVAPGCGGINLNTNQHYFGCITGNYLRTCRWGSSIGAVCGPGQTYRNGNAGSSGYGHTSGTSGNVGSYGSHGSPGGPGQSGSPGGSGSPGNTGSAGSAGNSGSPGNGSTRINRNGIGYKEIAPMNNPANQGRYSLCICVKTNHFCGRSFNCRPADGNLIQDTGWIAAWNKNNTNNGGGHGGNGQNGNLISAGSGGGGGAGGAAGAQYSGNVTVNTF